MKRIPVPCDSCKKKFAVKKPRKKLYEDGLEGKLTIYYITCPHCKTKFVSFIENEKLKNLVKENRILHKRLATIKDDDEYFEAQEEFEKRFAQIDSLRKNLITRFSKYVS